MNKAKLRKASLPSGKRGFRLFEDLICLAHGVTRECRTIKQNEPRQVHVSEVVHKTSRQTRWTSFSRCSLLRRNRRICSLQSNLLATCEFHLRICKADEKAGEGTMNQIIYLVGLIVIIMAVLSFVGLR